MEIISDFVQLVVVLIGLFFDALGVKDGISGTWFLAVALGALFFLL